MLKKLSILLLLVGLKHVTCFPGFPGFMKIMPGPYDEGGMKYEGIKDEGVPSTTFPPTSPGLLSWMQCQPAFVAPTDGFVSCTNGNNIRSICTFTCDEGYEMLGSDSSKCDSYMDWKMKWSSDAPRCEKLTCEPVWDAPVDGSVRCTNGNNYGSYCRFTCDEGYIMLGSRYSRCYNSNTGVKWSNDAPRCEKSTCEPVWDAPVDGSITCSNGNNYGSSCVFDCDEGYIMIGSRYTTCRMVYYISYTGVKWTSDAPLCEKPTCEPPFDAPVDGSVYCTDGNDIGSVCRFACDEGYEMVGDNQSECIEYDFVRYWTNRAPICRLRTCQPALVAPTDGSVSCTDGNNFGSVCTFTCYEGTIMSGAPQSECQINETGINWTNDSPLCIPYAPTCEPAFEAPANGSVNCTDDNNIGSICTFTCDEGYELEGDDQSSCAQGVVTGVWTSSAPVCVASIGPYNCGPLVAPTDGSFSCTDGNNYGSICTFACDEGYEMVGDNQLQCIALGGMLLPIWTKRAPLCRPRPIILLECQPAFDALTDGSVSCTDGNNIGSVCTFTCDERTYMVGEPQSECQINGTEINWTNDAPLCIPLEGNSTCEPAFDSLADGSVNCTDGNFIGSVCTFVCYEGYEMVGDNQSECVEYDFVRYWTNRAPVCRPRTCQPAFVAPTDGSVSCTDGNNYGSICTFACDDETIMVGQSQSECQVDETGVNWTNDAPSCYPLPDAPTCRPAFDSPTNGSVSCTHDNFVGSVCTFVCDEGFGMVGDGQSECIPAQNAMGDWTNKNAPRCVYRTCQPAFVAPIDGSVNCTDGNNFGSICTFTCDDETIMVGEPQSECQINETGVNWTNDAPLCEPYDECLPALEAPAHGIVSCTDENSIGSVCTFGCNEGYVMKGEPKSECVQINGAYTNWTSGAPVCLDGPQIPCNHAFVPNSDGINYIQSPGYPHGYANNMNCTWNFDGGEGRNISVTFIDGYLEQNYDWILINPRGKTSNNKLTGVLTGKTVSSADGSLLLEMITDGSVTERGFNASYEFQDIPCSAPSVLRHGDVLCSRGSSQGSECVFTCDPGFKLVGWNTSTCLLNARWSHQFPTCIAVQCPPLKFPKFPYGRVSCTKHDLYGSVCRFLCLRRGGYVPVGITKCIQDDEGMAKWSNEAPVCGPMGMTHKLERTSRRGNFQQCQEMCAQAGGTLAQHSLKYTYKDDMMAITGGWPTWIGVNNNNIQNEWRYTSIDGGRPFPIKDTSLLVANWAKGQPVTRPQSCATIYRRGDDLVFNTLPCISIPLYGICEYP